MFFISWNIKPVTIYFASYLSEFELPERDHVEDLGTNLVSQASLRKGKARLVFILRLELMWEWRIRGSESREGPRKSDLPIWERNGLQRQGHGDKERNGMSSRRVSPSSTVSLQALIRWASWSSFMQELLTWKTIPANPCFLGQQPWFLQTFLRYLIAGILLFWLLPPGCIPFMSLSLWKHGTQTQTVLKRCLSQYRVRSLHQRLLRPVRCTFSASLNAEPVQTRIKSLVQLLCGTLSLHWACIQ